MHKTPFIFIMTDHASIYALGEDIDGGFNGGSLVVPVVYTEDVAKGNPLHIINANQTNDVPNVEIVDDDTFETRYIAIHDGLNGQDKEVLLRGRTKVGFGGTVTAGSALEVTATGLFIDWAGVNPKVGFALQSGVDTDFGMIYFDGALA